MHSTFLSFAVASALVTAAAARSLPLQSSNAQVKRAPAEWNYIGCWSDEGDRQLGGASYAADDMTQGSCISFCESRGYSLAGIEYARECFCGYNLKSQSVKKTDGDCNMACAGDASLKCGGPNRLTIFTSPIPNQVVTNLGPAGSGWIYKSCYEDSVYARTLSRQLTVPMGNSVLGCTTACRAAGYKIAGVEWGSECFCDNTINFNRPSGLEGCDIACDGNKLEFCGGSQKLNIYEFEGLPGSTTTTSTVSSTTTTTTTTRAIPTTTSVSTTSSLIATSSIPTTTSFSTTSSSTTTSSIPKTSPISVTSASTTSQTTTATATTTEATCTPTPKVSLEQQVKDTAALEFLQENNTIVKIFGVLTWKEFGNQTIGPTLGPIRTAIQNWVPCTTFQLSEKQLSCGSIADTRAFLACIIFWTSPYTVKGPNASVPLSALTKFYVDQKSGIIPGTGQPVIESDMTVAAYTLIGPCHGFASGSTLLGAGPHLLYYFAERNSGGGGSC